jgi:hypothetical protein
MKLRPPSLMSRIPNETNAVLKSERAQIQPSVRWTPSPRRRSNCTGVIASRQHDGGEVQPQQRSYLQPGVVTSQQSD